MLWQLALDGSPGLPARAWRQHGGRGCLAYTAATLFFSLILLKPTAWGNIKCMKRENLPWFISSAVLVAVSRAFV